MKIKYSGGLAKEKRSKRFVNDFTRKHTFYYISKVEVKVKVKVKVKDESLLT
jgi:hypothetical protein